MTVSKSFQGKKEKLSRLLEDAHAILEIHGTTKPRGFLNLSENRKPYFLYSNQRRLPPTTFTAHRNMNEARTTYVLPQALIFRFWLVLGTVFIIAGLAICAGWYMFRDIDIKDTEGMQQRRKGTSSEGGSKKNNHRLSLTWWIPG